MMKKLSALIGHCILLFGIVSCSKESIDEVFSTVGGTLTNEEAIAGLREALVVGTDTSVTILNKVDGYFRDEAVKILLPPEAQVMYENISKVPLASEAITALMDQTILAMNRAAEDAASEAKPIFVNAIKGITISDGLSIVKGNDSAATTYLKGKTYDSLVVTFQPKINASLTKPLVGGLSAQSIYGDLIDTYNAASLGGVLYDRVQTNSLSDHVTRKGLNGLFLKVAVEEKAIRKDPLARVTQLLQKVFGTN